MKRRNKRDECVTSRSFSPDGTKQARQMSNMRYYDVAERDKILGDLTKNVGRHNFGGDDFRATCPMTVTRKWPTVVGHEVQAALIQRTIIIKRVLNYTAPVT